jgi:FtsH-binding integral membrane protein
VSGTVVHGPDVTHGALRVVRRILLATLVLGLVGTGLELLLLEHFEEWRQMIPLGLIAVALLVLAWHAVQRGPAPVQMLQVLMLIFGLAGVLGLTLHYRVNAEF